jgi:adenosyl cobinamide kinase/adenosyl cobinamide phosphate guanylyltransferase
MTLTLVIGGVRSGKSARAQSLAGRSALGVEYIATADPADPEIAARIAAHVLARPADWGTTDAGDDLVAAVDACPDRCALIDGLGTWIAGVIHRRGGFEDPSGLPGIGEHISTQVGGLTARADRRELIVVAEQAGEGMLPLDRASRAWLDLLGEATQRLAAAADTVELVVAGRTIALPPAAETDTAGRP